MEYHPSHIARTVADKQEIRKPETQHTNMNSPLKQEIETRLDGYRNPRKIKICFIGARNRKFETSLTALTTKNQIKGWSLFIDNTSDDDDVGDNGKISFLPSLHIPRSRNYGYNIDWKRHRQNQAVI